MAEVSIKINNVAVETGKVSPGTSRIRVRRYLQENDEITIELNPDDNDWDVVRAVIVKDQMFP